MRWLLLLGVEPLPCGPLAGPLACGLLACGLLACAPAPTSLLVRVDSDLPTGVVAAYEVRASREVDAAIHRVDADDVVLPFSLALTPRDRDDAPVHVVVVALDEEERPLVRRTVDTRFLRGQTRRVDVALRAVCVREPACEDEGRTCVDGVCVDPFVDPSALPGVRRDEPSPLSPTDPPDGGVLEDGGTFEDDACVDDAPCELGPCARGTFSCEHDTCVVVATEPEGTPCEGGVCGRSGRCEP